MATVKVHCQACKSDQVIKHDISDEGKQRYQCKNTNCSKNTFLLDYSYAACSPGIKDKIVEMALSDSDIRDTSRVLEISINTVISELKEESQLQNVNKKLLTYKNCENIKKKHDHIF